MECVYWVSRVLRPSGSPPQYSRYTLDRMRTYAVDETADNTLDWWKQKDAKRRMIEVVPRRDDGRGVAAVGAGAGVVDAWHAWNCGLRVAPLISSFISFFATTAIPRRFAYLLWRCATSSTSSDPWKRNAPRPHYIIYDTNYTRNGLIPYTDTSRVPWHDGMRRGMRGALSINIVIWMFSKYLIETVNIRNSRNVMWRGEHVAAMPARI